LAAGLAVSVVAGVFLGWGIWYTIHLHTELTAAVADRDLAETQKQHLEGLLQKTSPVGDRVPVSVKPPEPLTVPSGSTPLAGDAKNGVEVSEALVQLGNVYAQLSGFVEVYDSPATAVAWHDQGLQALEVFLAHDREISPAAQTALRHARDKLRVHRVYALTHAGSFEEALRQGEALLQDPQAPPAFFYHGACWYSLAAADVAREPGVSPTGHAQAEKQFTDRSLELLRKAQAAGYFGKSQAEHMARDTDLDPIRSRPDFQLLLAEVEGRTKTAAR
jgi:hypothetical protein